MSEVTLEDMISYGSSMIQMPKSALRIFQLALDEDAKTEELADAIKVDPTFTARLLQQVNSPVYSRGKEIFSIPEAIARIGREQLAQLAAVLATASEVQKLDCDLLSFQAYWSHSLRVALLSSELGKHFGLEEDALFLAGLLHDLGKPIEFHRLGDRMKDVLEVSLMEDDLALLAAEDEVLGFNHCIVGAILAAQWNLPEVVVHAIRYHHDPSEADAFRQEVAMVALANAIEEVEYDDEFQDFENFSVLLEEVDERFRIDLDSALDLRTTTRAIADGILNA